MIVIPEQGHFTDQEIEDIATQFFTSKEYKRMQEYQAYYEQHNSKLRSQVEDKMYRNKTPNNYVPTPYYATVVDTMAGYLYQNVQYESENEQYAEELNLILDANLQEIKDMRTGTYSLAFNRGVELVYTEGDESNTDIKFASFNPLEWALVFNDKIEPDVWCGIRLSVSNSEDYDYNVDVVYKDKWQKGQMKFDSSIKTAQFVPGEERPLFFPECPVVNYPSEIIGYQSPFHVVITYIQALDYLMTSNSDEIEKLTEALLILGKTLKDEDLKNLNELKALMDIDKEEIEPKFLEKQMSPEFRKYVSELLINEIHKHSHVIDWYSPDSGMSGQVSSKALRTRLFDMDMFSRRIEQVFRQGTDKRIRLINFLMNAKGLPVDEVKIIFNRTVPSDFYDKIEAFKNVTNISNRTQWEELGLDADEEEKRLEEQKKNAVDIFEMPTRGDDEEAGEEDTEDVQ